MKKAIRIWASWPVRVEPANSSRATLFRDQDGRYHFECNVPDHIHMQIKEDGYCAIGINDSPKWTCRRQI